MLEKELEIAKVLAENASEAIMRIFHEGFEVEEKSSTIHYSEPVTIADKTSSKIIVEGLAEAFPGDAVLSEEEPDNIERRMEKLRVWIIDPLDGTKGYINDSSSFAVMIGLCKNGVPELGIVYAPARDKLYYAEKGKGAYLRENGALSKISVSITSQMKNSVIATYNNYGRKRDSDEMFNTIPVLKKVQEDSAGIKLCLVAEGKADIYIHTSSLTSKWDTCAPQIILEEAGGSILTTLGEKLNYKQELLSWEKGFVSTNALLHNKVVTFLENYSK